MGVRLVARGFATLIFYNVTIAHDKGKPVVRQGRKATSLLERFRFALKDGRVAEGDLRESSLHRLTIWLRRSVARYFCFTTRLGQLQNPKSFGAVLATRFCLASPAKVPFQYLDRFFPFFPQKISVSKPGGALRVCRIVFATEMFAYVRLNTFIHTTRTNHLVPSASCCRR